MAVKKDEKTGTWYFYGSYKMKNGKYRQYKKRGFPKKKDAVKAEIIFKENAKDPYKNITLEELFNVYAAYTEKRIKESTYKVQNRLLERWIDILGDVNIKSITTNDIEVAMELMLNNVGYETAKNYLSRINKMMRFAVRKGYLETNPCSPIELFKDPNEKKTEMQYWTLEQFNLFIPYVENPLYHLLFTNQFYMGMRIGETLALTWEDVDLEKMLLWLKKHGQKIYIKSQLQKLQTVIERLQCPSSYLMNTENLKRCWMFLRNRLCSV